MDLEKVDKDISNCLEKINTDEKILEELTKKENDILLKLTTLEEENKEEEKKELEKIDSQKRIISDDISKLKKELEALKNKKLFLEPVNEVVFDNSLKDREKEIVEKYNNMVYNFSDALQRDLK
jgi:prefoldin subunit 5